MNIIFIYTNSYSTKIFRWFYARPHHKVEGTPTSVVNAPATRSGVCVCMCMCVYSLSQRRQALRCLCECEAICSRKHRLGTHVDLTVSPGYHTDCIYNIYMHIQICTYTYIHWTSHTSMSKAVLCTHARTRTPMQHTRRCQRLFCARTLAHAHLHSAQRAHFSQTYTHTHMTFAHTHKHSHTHRYTWHAPKGALSYINTQYFSHVSVCLCGVWCLSECVRTCIHMFRICTLITFAHSDSTQGAQGRLGNHALEGTLSRKYTIDARTNSPINTRSTHTQHTHAAHKTIAKAGLVAMRSFLFTPRHWMYIHMFVPLSRAYSTQGNAQGRLGNILSKSHCWI